MNVEWCAASWHGLECFNHLATTSIMARTQDIRRIDDASLDGDEDDGEPYTPVVKIPQYDVTGEMPDIADLVETDNTDRLIAAIDASTVPKDVKTFLRCAAHRHMRFNYRAIAEFYAHADEETQRLFEQSALVIIDFEDAIANGFAVFSAAVAEIRARDDET